MRDGERYLCSLCSRLADELIGTRKPVAADRTFPRIRPEHFGGEIDNWQLNPTQNQAKFGHKEWNVVFTWSISEKIEFSTEFYWFDVSLNLIDIRLTISTILSRTCSVGSRLIRITPPPKKKNNMKLLLDKWKTANFDLLPSNQYHGMLQ